MADFRETISTADVKGNRKWVYPAQVAGYFKTRRRLVALILLLLYVVLPWVQVSGQQAVFLDILNRKFVFFGATFWANDTRFLFFILCGLGVSLFFFTSVFGRIWCGWGCPETIFLEFVYRPIESLIEGNAAKRERLDAAPWNGKKVFIKSLKYLSFAVVSWFLASTVLAYFVGRERLISMMLDYPWNNLSTFVWTVVLMSLLLFQFGWFREQFCTILCPYARFQSVLLDDSSLLVGYDIQRGEPRGKAASKEAGACIDCGLCVRVCPTRIDIRNGLQLECIQCAMCADACDSIMVKIGRPTGLIRYDTERGLKGEKTKFLRMRVIIYALILSALVLFFLYALKSRKLSEAFILHSKDALYTSINEGLISNHLNLHLANKDSKEHFFSVSVENAPEIEALLPGSPYKLSPQSLATVPLFVSFPPTLLQNGKLPVIITVRDENEVVNRISLTLLGPG